MLRGEVEDADDAADETGTAPAMPEPAATLDLGDGKPLPVLIPESEQFANRLRKNARLRRKWAKREGVSCYRVYDADLPDYSAAIDLYEGLPADAGPLARHRRIRRTQDHRSRASPGPHARHLGHRAAYP